MKAVLATLYAAIRDLTIAISPVVPETAARLLDTMGIAAGERDHAALGDAAAYDRLAKSDFRLAAPSPVFPRLDMPPEAA